MTNSPILVLEGSVERMATLVLEEHLSYEKTLVTRKP